LLADFSGQRACDRRLKILIDAGYLERKKVLYGVPAIYFLTHKGKMLIGANKRENKIRVEQIIHDIAVIDTAIYFIQKRNVSLDEITTEKQMYSKAGFNERKHYPDFIYEKDGVKNCVEIELSLKSKTRFENIIGDNYLTYNIQFWVVAESGIKIKRILQAWMTKYQNIKILNLKEVQEYVRFNN